MLIKLIFEFIWSRSHALSKIGGKFSFADVNTFG